MVRSFHLTSIMHLQGSEIAEDVRQQVLPKNMLQIGQALKTFETEPTNEAVARALGDESAPVSPWACWGSWCPVGFGPSSESEAVSPWACWSNWCPVRYRTSSGSRLRVPSKGSGPVSRWACWSNWCPVRFGPYSGSRLRSKVEKVKGRVVENDVETARYVNT